MILEFERISERDIDLLLMRQFATDTIFLKELFINKIDEIVNKNDISVLKIGHSVMTVDGESDIEVILQLENKKVALLIEDKIDAIAQPQQSARYQIRGKKAVAEGRYDEFYVYIVAPQKYLDANAEAQKYLYKVSFEEMSEFFKNEFDSAIINKALDESKSGYIPVGEI